MNDKNKEQELPLGIYRKGKRTTVNRIVLPFQSLEVVETINKAEPRKNWEESFAEMHKNGDDRLLIDTVFEDENWD